jgi:hypothetical protein
MLYDLGLPVFTIATTDDHIFEVLHRMDNQRPQLDLKFYKDIICPDRNGAPLRTLMTIFTLTRPFQVPIIAGVHQI